MGAHFLEGAVHSHEQVLVCLQLYSHFILLTPATGHSFCSIWIDMKILPTNAYADIRKCYILDAVTCTCFGHSVSIHRDVLYEGHITKTSKTKAKILNIKL